MASDVSGYLTEKMAPELQRGLAGPMIKRSFGAHFPLITLINKAHVLMLRARGIIDAETASQLAEAILNLGDRTIDPATLNPALEDSYFNYEALLTDLAGVEAGGRLHIGRSRNDLKSTIDRMRARSLALKIMADLNSLQAVLLERGKSYAKVVAPGYTHMQPAQPITYGYLLLGVAHALARDYDRIAASYPRLNACPLGAAAVAGTSFPIDRRMAAVALGFDDVLEHAQDAIATRDSVIELLFACTMLATTIGRFAQDLYLMTTYEFGTISLPDSVAITSSIMPQKKNMAALESVKGRVSALAGALVTAITAYKGVSYSHSHDGNMESMRWVWDALEDLADTLPIMTLIAKLAEPDADRMLALVRGNFSTATDLADALVTEAHLSFREAHHVVGRTVRLAMDAGRTADQITLDLVNRAANDTLGRPVPFSAAGLASVLDPAQAIERRAGTGGPATTDMDKMITTLSSELQQRRNELMQRSDKVREASEALSREFAELCHGGVAAGTAAA